MSGQSSAGCPCAHAELPRTASHPELPLADGSDRCRAHQLSLSPEDRMSSSKPATVSITAE